MKASELIEVLKKQIEQHGDLTVAISDTYWMESWTPRSVKAEDSCFDGMSVEVDEKCLFLE